MPLTTDWVLSQFVKEKPCAIEIYQDFVLASEKEKYDLSLMPLDQPLYSVNYTIKDTDMWQVQFQHNFAVTANGKEYLLERIYCTADSLETLREPMYTGRYFDKNAAKH